MRLIVAGLVGGTLATGAGLWLLLAPPPSRLSQVLLLLFFAAMTVLVALLVAHKVVPEKTRWAWAVGVMVVAVVALSTVIGPLPHSTSPTPTLSSSGTPSSSSGTPSSSSGTPSTSSAPPVPIQLSIDTLTPSLLETGKTYTVTGAVNPIVDGAVVSVFVEHTELPIGSGEVAQDGSFSVPIQFTNAAAQVEITARLAHTDHQESSAASGPYDIYGWQFLTDIPVISHSKNYSSSTSQELNQKPYNRSISFRWSAASFGGWRTGDATFNLDRCTKLSTVAGVDDQASGDMARWSFEFSAGGKTKSTGYISLFSPKKTEFELDNAPRLKISASRYDPDQRNWQPYKGDAVLGDPRVLCIPNP